MPKSNSDKRIAANRANAARSTGPRTAEGKARSAQNARKHGFTASRFAVVKLEDIDSVANLRDDAVATYQPVNSQELFAVERIALAQHALLRCAMLEAGLHTEAMNEIISADNTPKILIEDHIREDYRATLPQNLSLCLAIGFRVVARKSDSWKLFLRYQAQTERLYRRAIEDFDRLRALRQDLPNEPIPQPEIEEPVILPKKKMFISDPDPGENTEQPPSPTNGFPHPDPNSPQNSRT